MTNRTIRTSDGLGIDSIVRTVGYIPGFTSRGGTNHTYVLYHRDGNPRTCPVSKSTHAKHIVVPWIRRITGYSSGDIYTALKKGKRVGK